MIQYWFLTLTEWARLPKVVLASVLFLLLGTLFAALSGLLTTTSTDHPDFVLSLGTCLFFAFINAYAIVGGAYVLQRTEGVLDQVADSANLSAEERQNLRSNIRGLSSKGAITLMLAGLAGAVLHNLLLQGGWSGLISSLQRNAVDVAATVGTTLTWIVLVHVATAFSRNALAFAKLTERLDLDLATPTTLAPFGTIAIVPTLGLVGTQLPYPLLWLDGSYNLTAVLPGFTGTLITLLYLFFQPSLPLHRRLKSAKLAEQTRIEAMVVEWRQSHNTATRESLAQLQPLLAYREYVASLPIWPFDMSALARWGFYLTIPPLTWVAAALVEMLLERFV